MEKKGSSLPLPTSSAALPRKNTSTRLINKALILSLSAFALVQLARSQLLFPEEVDPLRVFNHFGWNEAGAAEVSSSSWDAQATGGPRIAIIGAGAGGSSAAYFLKHFSKLTSRNLSTQVTIYEASDYIGGRSTVLWPWADDPYAPPRHSADEGEPEEEVEPVELGASIFVEANKNLQRAVREFGLETTNYGHEEDGDTGIWDGEKFVFKESGKGWWDKTKLLWRYGRSPFKVKALVKTTVESFTSLYSREYVSSPSFPFTSLLNFSASLDLLSPAALSGSEYFASQSVSPLFTSELISAATQVNYGTPIDEIHGLGGLVSLAANGAVSVKGGNRQIFEQFVVNSEANLRLGTKVKEIVKLDKLDGSERSKWVVKTESGDDGGVYDAVILAAPFHQASISIPQLPSHSVPPPQTYVNLHVTILLTNASAPLASYFGLSPKSTAPNSIFSTFTTPSTSKPNFNSLNYLKPLPASIGLDFDPLGATVHVVKLFSAATLSTVELDGIFGRGNVLKTIEHVWQSYPRLDPVRSERDLAKVRLEVDGGLYYVNGMERVISTMETETVSAYNVVSLLMKDFFGYKPPLSWAEWGERRKPN
ncbi:hypothetical protein JCM11491_000830 [Sporobolomyces phaffii]